MRKLLALHGPNLNLLGTREPDVYGTVGMSELQSSLTDKAATLGIELEHFQSNAEHELIARVQAAAGDGTEFILANPAGLTHTSVPLRDAFAAVAVPFIEVHLSNPHAREPFRHRSLFSDIAVGVIAGFGVHSYELALEAAARWISAR